MINSNKSNATVIILKPDYDLKKKNFTEIELVDIGRDTTAKCRLKIKQFLYRVAVLFNNCEKQKWERMNLPKLYEKIKQ